MKEKPICVEQGQKLAKEVTEPLWNLKRNVKAAQVIIANIYCAFTVCQALCWVLYVYYLTYSLYLYSGGSDYHKRGLGDGR